MRRLAPGEPVQNDGNSYRGYANDQPGRAVHAAARVHRGGGRTSSDREPRGARPARVVVEVDASNPGYDHTNAREQPERVDAGPAQTQPDTEDEAYRDQEHPERRDAKRQARAWEHPGREPSPFARAIAGHHGPHSTPGLAERMSWFRPGTAHMLCHLSYEHVLVVCDGSVISDDAVRSASRLAARDHARLTVVAVAETERPSRRCIVGTSTWNDVLRDAATADLERARNVVESPAHFAVLCGERSRAVRDAARELGCDAIMLPRQRRTPARILRRDLVSSLRRSAGCAILQPR